MNTQAYWNAYYAGVRHGYSQWSHYIDLAKEYANNLALIRAHELGYSAGYNREVLPL